MNVGLISPPFTFGKKVSTVAPPLGLASIAAVLRREGIKVKILDAYVLNLDLQSIVDWVDKNKFDIVGVGAVAMTIARACEIITAIKKRNDIAIVIGGPQPTVDPINTMRQCKDVNFLVKSEGEFTMLELVKNIDHPETIKGLLWRKDSEIMENENRPFIENLDSLPMPARDLLPMDKYRPIPGSTRYLPAHHIIVTRGCPYQCTFCSRIFGKIYRKRSAQKVLEELFILRDKYGVRGVVFQDDLITLDRKWLEELCDLMIEKKLGLSWFAHARVNVVTEDSLKKMRQAGCFKVGYGIESADKQVLANIKKNLNIEQAKKAVYAAHRAGLRVLSYFMLGLPGDTKQTCLKTINLAIELNPDTINFNIVAPFPGTELARNVDKYGKIYGDLSRFTNDDAVFAPYDMTVTELEKLQALGYRKFYLRGAYIFKQLRQIRSKDDVIYLLNGFKTLIIDKLLPHFRLSNIIKFIKYRRR